MNTLKAELSPVCLAHGKSTSVLKMSAPSRSAVSSPWALFQFALHVLTLPVALYEKGVCFKEHNKANMDIARCLSINQSAYL